LRAWLDAFNSGDRAKITAYHARYDPAGSVDGTIAFARQTGGFELLSAEKNGLLRVEFVVKEKASTTQAVGRLEVADADRADIAKFSLRAIPPGLTAADMNVRLDAAARARVVDGVVAKLEAFYVFPETAQKMAEALREKQERGEYDRIVDGDVFAATLTEDLRAVSGDKHLGVRCVPRARDEAAPDPEMEAHIRAELERMNCGFAKPQRLEPNIGLIKFDMFADAAICGPTATAAFAELEGVDAIIFDLRDNGGGEPEMVAFVSSYLFAKRTHLNDIYERPQDKTTEYWTRTDVSGKKFARQPVFVLTSHRTFSGAEEFAYNLKNLKRATIVGETTGGGAHPTEGHRIDDHFVIGVPFARAVNPITKTNWEGTGVEPDVSVPADRALDVARDLAAGEIAKKRGRKKK
jgi:hypothetical protein